MKNRSNDRRESAIIHGEICDRILVTDPTERCTCEESNGVLFDVNYLTSLCQKRFQAGKDLKSHPIGRIVYMKTFLTHLSVNDRSKKRMLKKKS